MPRSAAVVVICIIITIIIASINYFQPPNAL